MRRSQSLCRTTRLVRRVSLKPRALRRATQLPKHEAQLQIAFRGAAVEQRRCANCGYVGAFVQAHHAVSRSLLKLLLGRKGVPVTPEVLWDPRNALLLCCEPAPCRCHERHTLAMRRIRRSALRPENWEFARELGLEWVLETEYPEAEAA